MTVKVKGIPFPFDNETTLIIPPIAIGALEQLQQRITEFKGDVADSKQVATVIDVAYAALLRNYPGMTRDEVGALIDVANMGNVFECVMDVSGMKRKALETGEPTGN
jgi:hypothetical protein